MEQTIYTIGYAGFPIREFEARLLGSGVNVLIDVRSSPFSAYHQDYNRDVLERALRARGIYYRNYAREFGARQTDPAYYTNGYLDFEKFAASGPFREGVEKLSRSMEQGYRFALMCAEIDPIDCHRAILVARAFADLGYSVIHLLPHEKSLTHRQLEARLLDRYFKDRDQCSLFDAAPGDGGEEDLLAQAYRRRNAEIGYHLQEETS